MGPYMDLTSRPGTEDGRLLDACEIDERSRWSAFRSPHAACGRCTRALPCAPDCPTGDDDDSAALVDADGDGATSDVDSDDTCMTSFAYDLCGAPLPNLPQPFTGFLDDSRFYDVALTAPQVQSLRIQAICNR